MSNLLMSKENPNGWKLEELLAQIHRELGEKNQLLLNDDCKVSEMIQLNNHEIMYNLMDSIHLQNDTMNRLDALGENQGPTGKPRIGNTK